MPFWEGNLGWVAAKRDSKVKGKSEEAGRLGSKEDGKRMEAQSSRLKAQRKRFTAPMK
jgi:hypothetical protein